MSLGASREYPQTLWTAILQARDPDSPDFKQHLDRLIRLYWKPVYWTLRTRWNKSHDDAMDLTQTFFTSFLEKNRLAGVGPDKGRFRTWLRVVLDNFMRNEYEAARAIKRGGAVQILSLDAFEDPPPIPAGTLAPEDFFDRAYAISMFRGAQQELKATYVASGREIYFTVFERLELDSTPRPRAEIARELGLAVSEVESYLRHARAAFAKILRARVRETLGEGQSLDEELKALGDALG